MGRRFPQDCPVECIHLHQWGSTDNSIWACDVLNMQVKKKRQTSTGTLVHFQMMQLRQSMNKRFPRDCTSECPHFHCWDMSIDDYICVCDALKVQVDECDMDFIWYSCPLPDDTTEEKQYGL